MLFPDIGTAKLCPDSTASHVLVRGPYRQGPPAQRQRPSLRRRTRTA